MRSSNTTTSSLVYIFGGGKSYQFGDDTTGASAVPKLQDVLDGSLVIKSLVCNGDQTWQLRGE